MNSKLLINRILLFILYAMIVFGFYCTHKDSNRKEIEALQNNKNISDEESLYGLAKIIFGDSLKSFKTEKNPNGKQNVTIDYGGNRAYTFYSEGNYTERIQLDTARYILLFFQAAKIRNLEELRLSVVKPYFVKEPNAKKETTEEFEVFRVHISLSEIEKISSWDNAKLLRDNKNSNNSNVAEFLNQVRLKWKIELNELNRIELK
jgi:hypothetical protein